MGDRLRAEGVEAVLLLSTQWFTVLGHQVQCDPHLSGTRTDENWYAYDYGHLRYDLAVDAGLAHAWADAIDAAGLQARRTRYAGFPVDTGTVTAAALLGPFPLAMVSCNLYADPAALATVAAAGVAAAGERRVAVVAVSGLSSGLIPRWITPAEDRIAEPEHDRWNRKILDALAAARRRGAAAGGVRARGTGRQPVPGARVPGRFGRGGRKGRSVGVRARLGHRRGRGVVEGLTWREQWGSSRPRASSRSSTRSTRW